MAPKKGISLHVYVICQVLGGYTPLTILPLSHLRPRYNLQLTWHNCSVLLGNYNGLNKALSNKMNAPRVGGGGLASGGTPRLRGRANVCHRGRVQRRRRRLHSTTLIPVQFAHRCTSPQPNNNSRAQSSQLVRWHILELARPSRTPKNSDCAEFKGRRKQQN